MKFSIFNALIFFLFAVSILVSIDKEDLGFRNKDELTIQSLFFKFAAGLLAVWFCMVGAVVCFKDLINSVIYVWMAFWNFFL